MNKQETLKRKQATLKRLMERPIAHRGLHQRSRGLIENTESAARAAIAAGFGIECDLQLSADGEAMVFHDFTLERLTASTGRVDALPARALSQTGFRDTSDRMLSLAAFLDLVGGQVPLVCEIKSRFDGDIRLARRAAEIASGAAGPLALKSFDPDVIAWLRAEADALGVSHLPLGVAAMARYERPDWPVLDAERKRNLSEFLHWDRSRPDFLSYNVDDLPHAVPYLCRTALGTPVMAWTVRNPLQATTGRRWADQLIFEGEDALGAEQIVPAAQD